MNFLIILAAILAVLVAGCFLTACLDRSTTLDAAIDSLLPDHPRDER